MFYNILYSHLIETEETNLMFDELEDPVIRNMMEMHPIPTYLWKKEGKEIVLKSYNGAAEKITSGRVKNYLNKSLEEVHDNDSEIISEIRNCLFSRDCKETKQEYHFEIFDEPKIFKVQYTFIPEDMVMVTTIDLTKQERLRIKSERSENQLKIFINSIPFDVFILDQNERYIMQNNMSLQYWGDFIGNSPEEVAPDSDTLHLWKDNNRRVLGGEEIREEVSFMVHNKLKNFYNVIVPVKEGGKVRYIMGVNIDITELRNLQKELEKSEENYAQVYKRAEVYKDIFIHDINNILQNILSSVELLNTAIWSGEKEENMSSFIDLIFDQIKRGSRLIDNIQKLSLLEIDVPIKRINIYHAINQSVGRIKESYSNKKLNISINSEQDRILIKANELIHDLLENIFINAIRYNNNDIVEINIDITLDQQENISYTRIEITDNGLGILDERKGSIFNRLDDSSQNSSGIGLGLSLVRKIIESYEGQIWVENRVADDPSQGSKFVLLIPIAD